MRFLHHGIFQATVLTWVAVFFLQGIFLTQGLNPGLQHCKQMIFPSEPPGKLLVRKLRKQTSPLKLCKSTRC